VWIGTSVENQEAADKRIPELLATPAKIRFLSMEPLLGPVNLNKVEGKSEGTFDCLTGRLDVWKGVKAHPRGIDWIIVGGESGCATSREMDSKWVRSIRNQCVASKVPFFFKQWGDSGPTEEGMIRLGKKKAGRLVDGREWNEIPGVTLCRCKECGMDRLGGEETCAACLATATKKA
jgi:protein gp37